MLRSQPLLVDPFSYLLYRIRHLPFLSADSVAAAPPDELAFLSPEDSFLLLPFLEEPGEDNSSSSANLIYQYTKWKYFLYENWLQCK